MTRRARRIVYPTGHVIGVLQLVMLRRQRGCAIADMDGVIVATRAHPVSGRLIPALFPTAREALRAAYIINEDTMTA